MLFVFLSFIAIAGSAFASPQANQYMDNVINVPLQNEIRYDNLDPASLQNFSTDFQDKVIFIGKVKGRAEYDKGTLSGLSKVTRFSECQGPSYAFGYRYINCTLKFENLKIVYTGHVKYGKMPKVNVKGKANISRTDVYVEINTAGNGYPVNLNAFRFKSVGKMKIDFTGLGPLNKYVKFLEDGYRSYVEAELLNSISQRFQNALNRAVKTIPLPL